MESIRYELHRVRRGVTRLLPFLALCLACAPARAQPAPPAWIAPAPAEAPARVALTWAAVSNAVSYTVKRSAAPGGPHAPLGSVTSNAFTDATASPSQTCYYAVSTVDATGESVGLREVAASPGVIVDNSDASGVASTGSWLVSALPGYYGANSVYATSTASNAPTATFTFTPALPFTGNYDIYLRWTAHANRSSDTPVDIALPDGTNTVSVDQTQNGGTWMPLGTFACEAGSSASVTVRNNTGLAGKNVSADAVQFVPHLTPCAPASDRPGDYTLLSLEDDFDGSNVNAAVWGTFMGRSSYSVSGGKLHLTLRYKGAVPLTNATLGELESEANWADGGIVADHAQKFGYHEARLRLPQLPARGVDTAYWHAATDELLSGYEIDAPEFFNKDTDGSSNKYGFGVWDHIDGARTWDYSRNYSTLGDVTRYVTVGLEWRTDNSTVVYLNGVKVYTAPSSGMNDTESILPANVILSTKVLDWLHPNAALDGAEALWDYARYYQKPGWLGAADGVWSNTANWGADGLPVPGFAAVFNVPSTPAAVTVNATQDLQSVFFDNASLPAHLFGGLGVLRLGAGKSGDASATHGGIVVNTNVRSNQTFNTALIGLSNLQFANLSRAAGVTLFLNGPITGSGSPHDVDFITTVNAIVLGQPLGAGLRHVSKAGDYNLTLPTNSQHTGETRIARGPVSIDALSSLGISAQAALVFRPRYKHSDAYRPRLTYRGAAAVSEHPIILSNWQADGVLDASGSGPLTWAGSISIGPYELGSTHALTTQGTFTLGGTNTQDNVFAADLTDAGATVTNGAEIAEATLKLTKANSGTWVLAGSNTIKAAVSVTGGKLVVGQGLLGSLDAPGVSVSGGAEFVLAREDDVTFGVPVSGSGALRKRGAGTLTLSGAHAPAGGTSVDAGTLALIGSITGSVTVASSATLTGTGEIVGGTTVYGALTAAPLRFKGALALKSSGRLLCPFAGNSGSALGLLAASNVSVTAGAKVDVLFNGPGSTVNLIRTYWRTAHAYPLLTAASIAGTLALGTLSPDAAGHSAAAYGDFSLQSGPTNVSLLWTPLPGLPDVDDPAVTITAPQATPVAVPSRLTALRVSAAVTGGPTTVFAWSQVSGPGTIAFDSAASPETLARFSADGTYVLRAAASNALGAASAEFTALVNPPAALTFRQGVSGYAHAATFIRGDSTNWNSGARDQLLVGRNNGGLRALFAFDLAAIPAEASVQSASLDLWTAASGSGTLLDTLGLHRLLTTFVEGTGDGSSAANGAGSGADWATRTGSPAAPWATPGGAPGADYEAAPLATLAGFNPSSTPTGTQFTFGPTAELTAAAVGAVAADQPLGLLLRMTNDLAGGSIFARLASDDNGTLARRPQLNVALAYPTAPGVWAGPAPSPFAGIAASLAGSVTNASSARWSVVSGPGAVLFGDAASPATSAAFSQPGGYALRLTASNALAQTSADLAVTVAPAVPPQLGAFALSNGQCWLRFSGVTGLTYSVQASSNLASWSTIFVTNPAALPLLWSDPDAAAHRVRFYRVLLGE